MKNKIILILLIVLFNSKLVIADQLIFNADMIETTEEGNIINGIGNANMKTSTGIEIYADKFTYDKDKKLLSTSGNVKAIDKLKNVEIKSQAIKYSEINQKITSYDFTEIDIDNKYFIKTKDIYYDHLNAEISSNFLTEVLDLQNNVIKMQEFKYSLTDEVIRGKVIEIVDIDNNQYFLKNGMISLRDNLLQGKDILVNFTTKGFEVPNAEPRLKGNSVTYGSRNTLIKKGIFTSCKNNNDKCPPWMITSSDIIHDKNKKQINYKNAWLKIYDVPVLYFPKFFHPDPSVKRRSGFLKPKFGNSNLLGGSINLPYFYAISESSDLTFSPRIFSANEFLLRSEFRKVTKNTDHVLDFSINKNDNDKMNGRKTHFFSESFFNLDLTNLDYSYINLNIQKSSSDNYLKKYSLKSQETIVNDNINVLKSSFDFAANKDDLWLDLSLESYETKNKSNGDRYEFIYPFYTLSTVIDFDKSFVKNFNLNSSGNQKTFNTNVYEAVQINDLLMNGSLHISKSGFENDFQALIKNVNSRGDNSQKFKEKTQAEILSMLIYNMSYPTERLGLKYTENFTPKLSLRFSPNETKNIKENTKYLNTDNIFSIDRIGESESIESGKSLTLGIDYEKLNNNYEKILGFNVATVFKDKVNNNLSANSTLNQKKSDVVGDFYYSPLDYLNFNYNFSLDNKLDTNNLHDFDIKMATNNFVTTFNFYEENNQIGNKSYFGTEIKYILDEGNSLSFSTRENKKNDLTEYYNLIYEYKNDCLIASIKYNKEYYVNNDTKPYEQLFFNITLIPLGTTQTENILQN